MCRIIRSKYNYTKHQTQTKNDRSGRTVRRSETLAKENVPILTPNIFVRKSFSLRRTVRPYGLKKEKYIRPSLQNNFLSLGSISYYSFPRRSLPPPAPSSGKKPLDRTSGVGKFHFEGRDGNSYYDTSSHNNNRHTYVENVDIALT